MTDKIVSPFVTRTFVLLKPDCIQRGLIGEVIKRLEGKGLNIDWIQKRLLNQDDVDFLYGKYKNQDFYTDLSNFMKCTSCIALIVSGQDAVDRVRILIGADHPVPGTIRGDFATSVRHNIVHASDSTASALGEIQWLSEHWLKS